MKTREQFLQMKALRQDLSLSRASIETPTYMSELYRSPQGFYTRLIFLHQPQPSELHLMLKTAIKYQADAHFKGNFKGRFVVVFIL